MFNAVGDRQLEEPPAFPMKEAFIVGKDIEGHWIALEIHGAGGGLFTSKDAALRYASFETGGRPGAVKLASEPLELRI
jgi:hypothetical protein